MARFGVGVAAPDGPETAVRLLAELAKRRLCLTNATLSATGGRLFFLAIAQGERTEDPARVERSLASSVAVEQALFVGLPSREEPWPVTTSSLVYLLASAPDRPGVLHELANAIVEAPAHGEQAPRRDIRYLSSALIPAEGLPGTCLTDAVFHSPELEGLADHDVGESLDDLARSIVRMAPGVAHVCIRAIGRPGIHRSTRAVAPDHPIPEIKTPWTLLVIGRDRVGLVRDVTGRLADMGASIVDSWMIALHDSFLIALSCVVPLPEPRAIALPSDEATPRWLRGPDPGSPQDGKLSWLVASGEADQSGIAAFVVKEIVAGGGRVTDLTARGTKKGAWKLVIEVRGLVNLERDSVSARYRKRFGGTVELDCYPRQPASARASAAAEGRHG